MNSTFVIKKMNDDQVDGYSQISQEYPLFPELSAALNFVPSDFTEFRKDESNKKCQNETKLVVDLTIEEPALVPAKKVSIEENIKQVNEFIKKIKMKGGKLADNSIQRLLTITHHPDFLNIFQALQRYSAELIKLFFSYDQIFELANTDRAASKLEILWLNCFSLRAATFLNKQIFAIICSKNGFDKISTLLQYRSAISDRQLNAQCITNILIEENGEENFLKYMQVQQFLSKFENNQNSIRFFENRTQSQKKINVPPLQPISIFLSNKQVKRKPVEKNIGKKENVKKRKL